MTIILRRPGPAENLDIVELGIERKSATQSKLDNKHGKILYRKHDDDWGLGVEGMTRRDETRRDEA